MTDLKKLKVTFVGSKQLGLDVLNKMSELDAESIQAVITYDDSADDRSVLGAFEDFSEAHGYPVHILNKQNELLECLQEIKPDICIVSNWYLVLTPEVLASASHGFLGFHASLLPSYRGNAPLVWALINGETRTGITLFYFDQGMDTGDLVAQRAFDVGERDTIASLIDKSSTEVSEILDEVYADLLIGQAPRRVQSQRGISYCGVRRPDDGLINWRQSATAVFYFIRAQTIPYPCAFVEVDGVKVRVKSSHVFEHPFFGVPGVVSVVSGEIVVACSEGAIVIDEVLSDAMDVLSVKASFKYGLPLG